MVLSRSKRCLLFAMICLASGCQRETREPREELRQLFADEWEARLQSSPLFASRLGDRRFDDQLSDVGLQAQRSRLDRAAGFLERLRNIDPALLEAQDRLDHALFARLLEDRLAAGGLQEYLQPITNRSGFHVSFPQLPDRIRLETVEHHQHYISRLLAFRHYAKQHIELLREGLRQRFVLPKVVLAGVEEGLATHIVDDPTQSLLYKPFVKPSPVLSAEEADTLAAQARQAIANSVVPGYREFLEFLKTEYLPGARDTVGASELPNGRAYYEHQIRHFTTLELTAQEIHDLGHREVRRIRAEMEEVVRDVGFQGTFADFLEFLRTDSRFYAPSPEALLEKVSRVLKRMDGELPRLFGKLPRMPYGIREVPAFIAPKTTTAYYERPAGDGTRAGIYFVNTYDLKSRPLYEVEALSLHEAVPGHHLQIALQQELEGVPSFRRHMSFTAFVEGWALYAERLGLEVGFYETPYDNFGRLTFEMWRACRLVVDTGLHAFGWTRKRSIDFLLENTPLSPHNVTTEVDRYISWPGQALAYKMGELKIRELRSLAEEQLGKSFDVRHFHDVVLAQGAVPLGVLESTVRAWIAEQTKTKPR